MKEKSKGSLQKAAMKAGLSEKTARKYLRLAELPQKDPEKARKYRTRANPFELHWQEIEQMLANSPGLHAKSILMDLQRRYEGTYQDSQIRTLHRLIGKWRCEHEQLHKNAKFMQKYEPGRQSQSDWTCMNSLNITIEGQQYDHLLFHFILSYSRFETIMISQSESFDTLTRGFEQAVLQTGGVCKEHRTDNLTAATQASGNKRVFTSRWQDFTNHYGVIPTKNNPGVSHENGKIEKSHDLLKKAIDQELMLRGSRNFGSMAEYEKFLQAIKDKRNWLNRDKFIEEQKALKPLPHRTFNEAILLSVRVNPESLIQVLGVTYSVPTRLISNWLKAYVYRDKIDLFLGSRQVLTLPRLAAGAVIDYRHLIDSLIRKPGAFDAYQHKAYLFPNLILRQAYDALKAHDSATASKRYCEILYLAKMQGEALVSSAVAALMDENKIPLKELIMQIIELSAEPTLVSIDTQISESCLDDYDELLTTSGVV